MKEAIDSIPEKLWNHKFFKLCTSNLILFTGFHMLNATFPFFIVSLGGDEAIAGLAAGLFAVFCVMTRPIVGWLLDNKGRRIVLLVGVFGMLVMPIIYSIYMPLYLIIFFRMCHGLVWSFSSTSINTVVCDNIPPSRFVEGMGYFGLTNAMANAIAPALGLALMYNYGFRTLFSSNIIIIILAFILMFTLSIPPLPANRKKASLINSFSTVLNKDALPASATLLFFLLPHGAVLNFVAMYAVNSGLGQGGIFFTCMAATTALVRLFVGHFADQRGISLLFYFSLTCQIIALLLLSFYPHFVSYVLAALLWGIGFGIMMPAMQAMAMRSVALERRGSASSTLLASLDIGLGLGAIIGGKLIKSLGYNSMFGIMIFALVLAFLIYYFWSWKQGEVRIVVHKESS